MNRGLLCLLWVLLSHLAFGQNNDIPVPTEPQIENSTTKKDRKEQKILKRERRRAAARNKALNPLAPSKAAFYSAIFPGLGQIYNKRYWKAPLVYGALGTGIYAYTFNQKQYLRYRNAFKIRRLGFTTDEFYDINKDGSGPDISDRGLQDAQKSIQSQRDLSLLIAIGLYVLNIIDANVDAHLKQYNISNTLSIDYRPFLEQNDFGITQVGLKMKLSF